jgi:hypothetical protein
LHLHNERVPHAWKTQAISQKRPRRPQATGGNHGSIKRRTGMHSIACVLTQQDVALDLCVLDGAILAGLSHFSSIPYSNARKRGQILPFLLKITKMKGKWHLLLREYLHREHFVRDPVLHEVDRPVHHAAISQNGPRNPKG